MTRWLGALVRALVGFLGGRLGAASGVQAGGALVGIKKEFVHTNAVCLGGLCVYWLLALLLLLLLLVAKLEQVIKGKIFGNFVSILLAVQEKGSKEQDHVGLGVRDSGIHQRVHVLEKTNHG